jgi:hypothetical protein
VRITHNLHFDQFKVRFYADHKPSPFGTIEMQIGDRASDYATIDLDSEADCDALIKAACAVKDMPRAANHAAEMTGPLAPLLPDRGRYDAKSVAEVEHCNAPWGSGSGEAPMLCELTAGHAGLHGNGGIEWGCEPGSAEVFPCKCGVTFRTAGAFQDHQDNALAMSPRNRPFHGWAEVGDDADTARDALQADIDAAVAAPVNPAYVNTGLHTDAARKDGRG